MERVALFITHRTQPGMRDQVRAVWQRHMQPAIAQNAAHEAYFYCFDTSDPDVIRVYQQYSDLAASQAFLQNASYAAYLRDVEPLLAGQPEVVMVTPLWVKGD